MSFSTQTIALAIPGYLLFEAAILVFALKLVSMRENKDTDGSFRVSERLLASLMASFVVEASIAFLLTLLKVNYGWIYLIVSLSLVSLIYRLRFGELLADIKEQYTLLSRTDGRYDVLLGIIGIFVAPIVIGGIRPIQEIDSLVYLNYLDTWLRNVATPYTDFDPGYVALWELTYSPSLSILHSDQFLWFNSLKAILSIFLAQYAIARVLGLNTSSAVVTAVAGVMLRQLWVLNSGITTIKNDMFFAAGFLTFGLGGIRTTLKRFDFETSLLLVLGLMALLSKYSGVLIAFGGILLVTAFNLRELLKRKRDVALWIGLSTIMILATTGHYYLRNIIVDSNPFTPFQISAGDRIIFEGPEDLSGTAITDHLSNAALWDELSKWFTSGGVDLSIIFALSLLAPLLTGMVTLQARIRQTRVEHSKAAWFAAFLVFLAWIVYLRSFWSAGASPDDLVYIRNLMSIRYVTGAILLAETLVIFWLKQSGAEKQLLLLLPAIVLGSRLQYLYRQGILAGRLYYAPLLIIAAFLVLMIFLLTASRRQLRLVIALCSVVAIVLASPYIFEAQRESWLPYWEPAWRVFIDSEPTRVGLIDSEPARVGLIGDRNARAAFLPVAGRNLQNTVERIPRSELGTVDISSLDYLVRFQASSRPDLQAGKEFANLARQYCFIPEIVTEYVVVARTNGHTDCTQDERMETQSK